MTHLRPCAGFAAGASDRSSRCLTIRAREPASSRRKRTLPRDNA
ncbi:hypothetical protein trd_A0807 (plasmid) [Thermomicrobium roseum DSM 5159]|uniref:Uncharacterized protein n=1 Tax=Thermomicrobium roseum (strain ATCC 27502 / DSM 5159 / P-2) TaxID=309801 RepID=B9L4U3_THERP|nr:hypothetical protein trd_A0807 [Thermomicrobium roseum DSM 5159]